MVNVTIWIGDFKTTVISRFPKNYHFGHLWSVTHHVTPDHVTTDHVKARYRKCELSKKESEY